MFNELFIAFDCVNMSIRGNCEGIKTSEILERNVLNEKSPLQALKNEADVRNAKKKFVCEEEFLHPAGLQPYVHGLRWTCRAIEKNKGSCKKEIARQKESSNGQSKLKTQTCSQAQQAWIILLSIS